MGPFLGPTRSVTVPHWYANASIVSHSQPLGLHCLIPQPHRGNEHMSRTSGFVPGCGYKQKNEHSFNFLVEMIANFGHFQAIYMKSSTFRQVTSKNL